MEPFEEELDGSDENDLYEHFRLVVDPGQASLRIDKFLANLLPHASRSRVQAATTAGSVRVNDLPVKSNYKVKPGDVVTLLLEYPKRELKITPENIPWRLYMRMRNWP